MSETSPPPSEAVIQTAARLLAAGRAAEAADRLGQLVDEAPTYAAAHVLLASALDASGRTTEALEIWRRAAFLVPHSPLVHRERQRLVDAHNATPAGATSEAAEAPIEAWDDDLSAPDAAPEDELPPTHLVDPGIEPETTDPENAKEDELATREEVTPDLELATEPDAPLESASPTSESAHPEPEIREAQPEMKSTVEEPLEMPLLPPEGNVSSMPRSPMADIELEDDGWTILEDDVAPPSAEAPISAPLLPPEPETTPAAPPAEPPPEPADAPEPVTPDSSIADDLDDLITQLDSAPRIKPDPTFSGPKVTFDESSMDDMVSETLAKIYAAQHQYVEAAVVYEKLAAREPEQADTMLERAAEMRDKAS